MKQNKPNITFHFLALLSSVVLINLLLIGCGLAATAAPTSTPVPPTSTPLPSATSTPSPLPTATATSAPTSTPTQVPSATPNRTATASANQTATAEAINAALAPALEAYGVDPADGHLAFADEDPGRLELSSYGETDNLVLKEVGKLTDFVVESEITWKTSGALSLCGITFHAEDDLAQGLQNRFFIMRLQFDPGWTVWRWQYGQFQSFVSDHWLPSSHIHDKNSSSNVLGLVVKGPDINVFINGKKERQVEDPKLKEGLLALSAFQESGSTMCQFKNTWVWVFDK
jgi:hypothetical protein